MEKPTLTVYIGPMGSGKSSQAALIKADFLEGDPAIISQDELGKHGHMQAFNTALNQRRNIIIDRCNFNREQRMVYVEPARAAGYEIVYEYFYAPYATCLARIVNRKGHPTICEGDMKTARKALDMYFKNEDVDSAAEECDIFVSNHECMEGYHRNVKFLDLTKVVGDFRRVILISDVHGCFNEMMKLLNKMGYDPVLDILIIVGDMNDRGPDADKVIKFAFNTPNVYCTMGNHDDKLRRWLRGNDVHLKSIQGTIEQLKAAGMIDTQAQKDMLYYWMMSFPQIIKIAGSYISHAGFNPRVHPEKTSTEYTMYARYFDDAYGTFTREGRCGYWFDKPRAFPQYNLFFGHVVIEDFRVIQDNIYPLDGGACFGEKMRGIVLSRITGNMIQIVEVDSDMPKKVKQDDEWDHVNKFEPYDKLVDMGYLHRKEKGNLVLYNYNEKCTYDAHWSKYTIESRGLILDKETGDTVARPFPKFFNQGELQNKLLPQPPPGEKFVVEEKLDGSLGILYRDPADNKLKIATRGSFDSDQAIIGTEILDEKIKMLGASPLLWLNPIFRDFTLLFEIIYPENRMNDGARLVVDYGSERMLVLLAGINKVTGEDLAPDFLAGVARTLDVPLRKEYNYTLEELVELKKTWPVNFEGVVVRYIPSNYRMKIKGDEYCKMQKILNSISPISIWEKMQDSPDFWLPLEYRQLMPEEILPEVESLEAQIREAYNEKHLEFRSEMVKFELYCLDNGLDMKSHKELGLWCQAQGPTYIEKKSGLFLLFNNQLDRLHLYVIKCIRPKGNIINGNAN